MCNVLKLAQSNADFCRYRLINYKSYFSGRLPHRGQIDRKKQAQACNCTCVRRCVVQAEAELHDLPGLINQKMTDNTGFLLHLEPSLNIKP